MSSRDIRSAPDDPLGRTLWRLAPIIYGPTLLFALGEGAVLPLLPVIAASRGADVATAALIASALVVGQLCGNLPAGWAVSRFGERATMIAGGLVALLGALALVVAPSLPLLAAAVFVIGFCAAVFGLARHAFMTTRVPRAFRARALSLLGGSFRLGMFIGPFVAAGLLGVFGAAHATIWFFVVCLLAAVLLVALAPDPERVAPRPGATGAASAPVGVFASMARHRGVLARMGVGAGALAAARQVRQTVLPLWGVSIGMDAQTIALVVGVSGAIDFALFYASGQVMDRFGRLWAALPAMLLMGSGFVALSLTHDAPGSAVWFVVLAVVLGLGNGLSSGILLTLGADLAPSDDPAPFLGSWRTIADAGGAAGPLVVAGLTAAASLPVAVLAIGVLSAGGAAAFARWIPRYVPRHRSAREGAESADAG